MSVTTEQVLEAGDTAAGFLARVRTPSDRLSAGADGVLRIEDASAAELVREHGSPLFVVSEATLRDNVRRVREAFEARWPKDVTVLYAIKANNNLGIRAVMQQEGTGSDCFGDGELYAAFAGGVDPAKVALNGSNKPFEHLRTGVRLGVAINVDHPDEIDLLRHAADLEGCRARVLLRLKLQSEAFERQGSGYGPLWETTADEIRGYQWGLPPAHAELLVHRVLETPGLELEGYHVHVARTTPDPAFYEAWAEAYASQVVALRDTTGFAPRVINAGGGYARERRDAESGTFEDNVHTIEQYADAICGALREGLIAGGVPLPELWIEPGRYLVGNAEVLLCTVGAVKATDALPNVQVDASVNNLMRIEMYGQAHHVLPASRMHDACDRTVNVVGSLCMGGPLGARRQLPAPRRDDLLAFMDVGAYMEVHGTQFNGVPRPATVLVSGSRSDVIRERESVLDVFAKHRVPEHLRR